MCHVALPAGPAASGATAVSPSSTHTTESDTAAEVDDSSPRTSSSSADSSRGGNVDGAIHVPSTSRTTQPDPHLSTSHQQQQQQQRTQFVIPQLEGDFSLNASNSLSVGLLLSQGLSRLTPTHELSASQVGPFVSWEEGQGVGVAHVSFSVDSVGV